MRKRYEVTEGWQEGAAKRQKGDLLMMTDKDIERVKKLGGKVKLSKLKTAAEKAVQKSNAEKALEIEKAKAAKAEAKAKAEAEAKAKAEGDANKNK